MIFHAASMPFNISILNVIFICVERNPVFISQKLRLFRALFMKCELIKSELPWQLNLTNNEKFRTRARKNWSNRRQRD